jgi:hypothetical protein
VPQEKARVCRRRSRTLGTLGFRHRAGVAAVAAAGRYNRAEAGVEDGSCDTVWYCLAACARC